MWTEILFYLNQLIFPGAEAQLGGYLNGVYAVAAVYPLHKMLFPGIIGIYYQVNACLIDGHRIQGCQDASMQ